MAFKIGMQTFGWAIYGWSYDTNFGLETVLRECAVAGYKYIDLSGFRASGLPKPDKCKAIFKKHKVKLICMSCAIGDKKRENLKMSKENVKFLAEMGAKVAMVSGWQKDWKKDKSSFTRLIDQADELHEFARGYKIKAAYHNHLDGPVETEEQIHEFLAQSKMKFCPDVGHMAGAGVDPVPMLKQYRKRIVHGHLKDVLVDKKGKFKRFIEIGNGNVKCLNFRKIFKTLDDIKFNGYFTVEQDNWSVNPGADALTSANYIRKLGRM